MLLIKLIYWKLIDLRRILKNGKKIHLYGIIGVVGNNGGGKTMALTEYLDSMRKKYSDKVYIATNYFYKDEDFHINDWKCLLPIYDKPVIFGYDEIANDFNSRDYKNFPLSLMTLLTQNRKGNGKQIIWTTPDYELVDKNFRRITLWVWSCKTRFGRLTSVKKFDREDYEMFISTPEVGRRMKIKPASHHVFVQTDCLREQYDSYQLLESATNKMYVDQLNKVPDGWCEA